MISLLPSFILLAIGAMASLAISVAGDIAHNFICPIKIDIAVGKKPIAQAISQHIRNQKEAYYV
ncbi:MAG: hypothetical protein V3V70_03525 [Candidatus Scalindua sp.]